MEPLRGGLVADKESSRIFKGLRAGHINGKSTSDIESVKHVLVSSGWRWKGRQKNDGPREVKLGNHLRKE